MATEKRRKKNNWYEIRVGLFILVCLSLMVFMLFRVAGGRGFFSTNVRAETYLPMTHGMKPGAPVWLNGIEVGHVEAISLDSKLPATKANAAILAKITGLENDLGREAAAIAESESRLANLEAQKASVSADAVHPILDAMIKEQDRLSAHRLAYDKMVNDIKTQRASLQSIKLTLLIDSEYVKWIKADSEVSLGSIGLLGDSYINISIGRLPEPARKLADGTVIIEGISEASLQQLMVSASQMLGTFADISDRVKSITSKVDKGEGTIGQLVNNTILYDTLVGTLQSLKSTVDKAGGVITDIREGNGTIGALIHSRELYDEAKDAIAQIAVFTKKLNGENSVGRLLKSTELYDNLLKVTGRVDSILNNIQNGVGTLGKLNTDDTFFVEAKAALQKLHSILGQVESGQGTLGQLLKNPAMYQSINEAVAELSKFLVDLRKDPKKYLSIKFRIF